MKSGSTFTLRGSQYSGTLYVEDEDNFGTYPKRGEQYNDDTNLYTRSNGVTCYTTTAYTSNKLYISTGGVYRELTQTLYTRSNGATRYTTTKVDTPLYRSDGTGTYPLYKPYTANKLYLSGETVTFNRASLSTRDVTALTV